FEVVSGRFHLTDSMLALHLPALLPRLFHTLLAAASIVAFTVLATMGWLAWRQCLRPAHDSLFRTATVLAAVCLPLQMGLGVVSLQSLVATQPAKLAAVLGHWHTGPANMAIVNRQKPEPHVPAAAGLASGVLAQNAKTQLPGLNDFADNPPLLTTVFVAFRIVLVLGLVLSAIGLLSAWLLHR